MKNKKFLGAGVFIVLIAILAVLFFTFSEKPVEGSKSITIEVIGKAGKSTEYALQTDAAYLKQAMEEADGLTFSGTEGDYGLMIHTVNGDKADYNVDKSYWSFYVNGEYCNYGIESQPVEDGDAFQIVYTIG